jgi:hypothetical protein
MTAILKIIRHHMPIERQDSELGAAGLPVWARGFRVEKAGPFQFTVVATEHAGH